ncbi:hypothetical protein CRG98_027630 [Punica granatum]|uniref:C3H1-type domain-containing protein n=1 Tax=Punica granatum TaxID=22663 RepID=A0A2I0J6V7_PUNGR|nr:hypothetical protein CRG98_027630 [Punica granatum]
MAASPSDGYPTADAGMDGQDSSAQRDSTCEPPIPQPSSDEAVSGEKRKREDGGDVDPSVNPLWKTSLCSYFRRSGGSCSHGSSCRYAHGEEELRQRPDGSWDPTSERRKEASSGKKREVGVDDEDEDEDDDDEEDRDGGITPKKCVLNLPGCWTGEMFRKFLDEKGIAYKSAKKRKNIHVGFLKFENKEQLEHAVQELDGKPVGSCNMEVADVGHGMSMKKLKREGETSAPGANGDASALGFQAKSARDAVTPYAEFPYSDQLQFKKNALEKILKKLTRNARKVCPPGVLLPQWIMKSNEIGGLACKLERVVASPLENGYRNKCEFTIGLSLDGKPTIGFTLGSFKDGVTAVAEPVDCPNVSSIAVKYASIFQEFLQQSSLPVWCRHKNSGFWRQFTVREGRRPQNAPDVDNVHPEIGEVMLIVQVCSLGHDNAVIASEFERMARAFSSGAAGSSPVLPLTHVVIQEHQGISNVAPSDSSLRSIPIQKPDGGPVTEPFNETEEPRIHDYINNLKFSISPTAFFQVNTLAAEKLYALAGDWAGLDADTLLFDVCCGTGTIGLTLAHRVGMVVGIEMNASAVSDAHRNAEINGINNCRFICGKAEDVMGSLLKEYLDVPQKQDEPSAESSDKELTSIEKKGSEEQESGNQENPSSEAEGASCRQFKNVVAIVDPPRGGLHPTVIKALRTHSRLRKLVYISCNPDTLTANSIELCSNCPEKEEKGKKDNRNWRNMSSAGLARRRVKSMPKSEPFRPVKAMGFDLFPHTIHCEMVMLMER